LVEILIINEKDKAGEKMAVWRWAIQGWAFPCRLRGAT
jgi:hypothetical protein